MSSGGDEDPASWSYQDASTTAGALQHGLGRGAFGAMVDPAGPALVADCLRRDHRWDWQVDEREVYLARLVRDLGMPVTAVTGQLFAAPPRDSDDDHHQFELALDVVEVLGRAGIRDAVDEIRRYVRDGERWVEVLQAVAAAWPPAWWDDLLTTAVGRLDATAERDVLWRSAPWPHWASRDRRIGRAVQTANARHSPPRPFGDTPVPTLLALLRAPHGADDRRAVLRELRRRPPDPGLLDLVDELVGAGLATSLAPMIMGLGEPAVTAARRWADEPGHPLAWTGRRLLAVHGDAADLPALVTAWDWLDTRPDDLCGYDELAAGIARIGGAAAADLVPRIRTMWFSPHSYERPRYLAALIALDPGRVNRLLVEGLWDCEAGVRLLAVQHAPLDELTRRRLCYLRDDPIETSAVRAAATDRLA